MAWKRRGFVALSIIGLVSLIAFAEFSLQRWDFQLDLSNFTSSLIFVNEKVERLSVLGEWLHTNEDTPPPKNIFREDSLTPLLILVWRYGPFLERRHIRRFTDNNSFSPWQDCSVKNCRLSYRDEDLKRADAVIFHLHMTKGVQELPYAKGKPGQIWIFMTDESPFHTFLYEAGNQNITDYDDLFDWSMTYRTISDVPVAYGRTIKRQKAVPSGTNGIIDPGKTNVVAIMGSNCSSKNRRWIYVRELQKLLGKDLHIYGRCLGGNTTACPGHFDRDCPLLSTYKFYLAFENSNCREYITEKVYWNAYEKRSVPIIMGAPKRDCRPLLPPNSFIHVEDFYDPADLAGYLRYLDADDDAYLKYHEWRSRYVVLNEHGYFGSASKHYCRVCEALHYNEPPTEKYKIFGSFWNTSRDCDNSERTAPSAPVQIGQGIQLPKAKMGFPIVNVVNND